MAVSFLAASALQVVEDSDSSPRNFTLSVGGTTRGVLVLATSDGSGNDRISAVNWGGQALARVTTAADTAGEQGRSYAYFLGVGVPTGSNTLAVSHTTGSFKDLVLISLAGDADLEVADFGALAQNQASPRVTLTPAREAIAACCIFSGLAAVGNLSLLSGMTAVASFDIGSQVIRFDRQTSVSASPFEIGYTSSNDDVAFVAVSVQEVASGADQLLAGTAAGTSTATSVLTGIVQLAVTVAGSSTGSAVLTGEVPVAGSAGGASSGTGNLTVELAPFLLAGSAAGSSSVVGVLTGDVPLAGMATGGSTGQAVLTGETPLAATTAGASSATGNLTFDVGLAGAAAGSSTSTAGVSLDVALNGTTAGTSTTTADLTIAGVIGLSGAVSGVSTAIGDLTVVNLNVLLAGTAAGMSAAASTLELTVGLAGTVTGVSTVAGGLTLDSDPPPRLRLEASGVGYGSEAFPLGTGLEGSSI